MELKQNGQVAKAPKDTKLSKNQKNQEFNLTAKLIQDQRNALKCVKLKSSRETSDDSGENSRKISKTSTLSGIIRQNSNLRNYNMYEVLDTNSDSSNSSKSEKSYRKSVDLKAELKIVSRWLRVIIF